MPIDVEAWYRQHGPMVFRRCRQILRDDASAADVMQDVFVKVLRNRDRLDDRAPLTLLYRMATNASLNRIRDSQVRNADSLDETVHAIAQIDEEPRSWARDMIAKVMGAEPVSTREIVALHLIDGLTYDEVAHEVGMSVSGVRKRLRVLKAKFVQLEAAT